MSSLFKTLLTLSYDSSFLTCVHLLLRFETEVVCGREGDAGSL